MTEQLDVYQGKSIGDLGREAIWFLVHTIIAILVVVLIVLVGTALHADPDAVNPKVIATVLSFLLAMLVGLAIAKARHDYVARYVWISGLLFFAIMCVWVLGLPTGNGLCEHCMAMDKLTRTFFSIQNGSGLLGGRGLLLGCWIPLALVGYAVGAQLGLGREPEVVVD